MTESNFQGECDPDDVPARAFAVMRPEPNEESIQKCFARNSND